MTLGLRRQMKNASLLDLYNLISNKNNMFDMLTEFFT